MLEAGPNKTGRKSKSSKTKARATHVPTNFLARFSAPLSLSFVCYCAGRVRRRCQRRSQRRASAAALVLSDRQRWKGMEDAGDVLILRQRAGERDEDEPERQAEGQRAHFCRGDGRNEGGKEKGMRIGLRWP